MKPLAAAMGCVIMSMPMSMQMAAARAQDFRLDGLLELRTIYPSDQRGNLDGGLGKTEWGSGNRPTALRGALEGLTLRGIAGLTPELRMIGEIRADPRQKTAIDLLDAYALWRPVSTTRDRWTLKTGIFFPPISLENTGIGWTSNWTLTPSAINSWVGDELRVLGGEAGWEWRGDVDTFEIKGAVYGWNQPAGVAIADRGWTFNSAAIGLFDHIRLPDILAPKSRPGQPAQRLYSDQFRQFDDAPGWYAAASWERPDIGKLSVMRYDNQADPSAKGDNEVAWRTKFWSLGFSTDFGGFVVLAQAMLGSTEFTPSTRFSSTTDFYAGYVLVGWQRESWRYALRLDQFGTREHHTGLSPLANEHGRALTGAITWSPHARVRITAEILGIDSWRAQRALDRAKRPHVLETQAQLALRLTF